MKLFLSSLMFLIFLILLCSFAFAGVIENPKSVQSGMLSPRRHERLRSFPLRNVRTRALNNNNDERKYPESDSRFHEPQNDQDYFGHIRPGVSKDPWQFNNVPMCGAKYIWRVDRENHVYFEAFSCEEDRDSVSSFEDLRFMLCPANVALNQTVISDYQYLSSIGCLKIPDDFHPAELQFQDGVVGWSAKYMFQGLHLMYHMRPEHRLILRWTIVAILPSSSNDMSYLQSSNVRLIEHEETEEFVRFTYLENDGLLEYQRIASSSEPHNRQEAMDILRPYSNEAKGIVYKYEKVLNALERDMTLLMDKESSASKDMLKELLMKGKTMQRLIQSKMVLLDH